jgi:hypothetical protein
MFFNMKNFFEFFGFLSTAAISAVLIFLFIGRKDALKGTDKALLRSELSSADERDMPEAPQAVAMHPSKSNGKKEKPARGAERAPSADDFEATAGDQLKNLYEDDAFVGSTAKKWKSAVKDAADEYNIKPQVLLAHVLVQSYLGRYTQAQLEQDAARHAGERLKSTATALKSYRYGWSMQQLLQSHDLLRYFPEEMPTAAASSPAMRPERSSAAAPKYTPKGSGAAPVVRGSAAAGTSTAEEGFRNMVAKEQGFSTWAGLQRLADPETKTEAQKRVRALMMAAKVK